MVKKRRSPKIEMGFNLIELLVVLAIALTLIVFAIPLFGRANRDYSGLRSSAYNLANSLNQAKFRSTAEYTPYRLQVDANPGTSWRLQRKTAGVGTSSGTWTDIVVGNLNRNISFTTTSMVVPSGVTSADSNRQCGGGTGVCAAQQATMIAFNVRGVPVDNSGAPQARNAIYLTDGIDYFAITVSLSGQVAVWRLNLASKIWFRP